MRAIFWCGVWCAVVACSSPVPGVCCTATEDCNAIGLSEPRPCNDDLVCSANICVEPECRVDSDCGGGTPRCAPDLTCVACLDAADCTADAPVCSDAHACSGCTADTDCTSSVCEFDSGSCVDPSAVLYASPEGGAAANCTREDMCSLSHAVDLAAGARNTIKLAAGDYSGAISIAGKQVTFHAFDATLTSDDAQATIDVADGGLFRIYGGSIHNVSGVALKCDSSSILAPSRAILNRVTLEAITVGVAVYKCTLTATRARLYSTASGFLLYAASASTAVVDGSVFDGGEGITSQQGDVRVTNSVFLHEVYPYGAVQGAAVVSFSTFIDTTISVSNGDYSCVPPVTATCIDNSVALNTSPTAPLDTFVGTALHASYTIVFPQSSAVTGDHNSIGVNPRLVDPTNGDFRLQVGSPAIDAADPAAVNAIDYDGKSRPVGTRSDLGAFEYRP